MQKRREESRRLKGACNLEREWERGIHKRLAGLGEAGLHSMHAIMASTSCHELKRRLAVAVVVVVSWRWWWYGSSKCEANGPV